MTYSDEYGVFFGRIDENGNVNILHVEDGLPATRLDASVYPVGSSLSARYEHPEGIVLTREDAARRLPGLEIEGNIIVISDGTESTPYENRDLATVIAEYTSTYGFNDDAGDVVCTASVYADGVAWGDNDYISQTVFTITKRGE